MITETAKKELGKLNFLINIPQTSKKISYKMHLILFHLKNSKFDVFKIFQNHYNVNL